MVQEFSASFFLSGISLDGRLERVIQRQVREVIDGLFPRQQCANHGGEEHGERQRKGDDGRCGMPVFTKDAAEHKSAGLVRSVAVFVRKSGLDREVLVLPRCLLG